MIKVLHMFALGIVIFVLIAISIYFGWLFFILKAYQSVNCPKALIPIKIIMGLLLAIIPFYNALVYPLIKNECSTRGGTIIYAHDTTYPRTLLIEGKYYNLSSRQPLSDLFSKKMFDSVYIGDNSSYGESRNFINATEIYDEKAFDLHITDTSNVECGPY